MKKTNLVLGMMLIMLLAFCTNLIAYSGGTGTSGDPYEIASVDDLIDLSKTSTSEDWSAYFIQTADIAFDANEQNVDWDNDGTATWDAGDQVGFSPIGNNSTKFTGSYDGNEKTIDNIYIDRVSNYIGLFGYVDGSATEIDDLGVTNVDIIGNENVGGLVGRNYNNATVSNCYSTGTVYGSANYVGGLVGYNWDATVSNCYSTGTVSGSTDIGGLVGQNYSNADVINCYSTGAVSGAATNAGGLVGRNRSNANVNSCYSSGTVSGNMSVGGLVGKNEAYVSSNSFWDTQTSGQSSSSGGTGKTTNEMKGITPGNTISDWLWSIDIWERVGENYPRLINNPDPTLPVTLSSFFAQFIGSSPILCWTTQSETDNIGWYVYRNEEENFTGADKISELIEGHGTTSQQQSYIYEDSIENPEIGNTYYYWLESIDYSGIVTYYDRVAVLTIPYHDDPGSGLITIPEQYGLLQNEPNPVISSTNISFNLASTAHVDLVVYNINGQLVKILYSGVASSKMVQWDGKDEFGKAQKNGIYLYKLEVNGKLHEMKQMILLR